MKTTGESNFFISPVTGIADTPIPLEEGRILVGTRDGVAVSSLELHDLKIVVNWLKKQQSSGYLAPLVIKEKHPSFPNAMSLKDLAIASVDDGPNILRADTEGNLRVSIPDEDHAPAENPRFKGEYIGIPVIKKDDPSYSVLNKGHLRIVEDEEGL